MRRMTQSRDHPGESEALSHYFIARHILFFILRITNICIRAKINIVKAKINRLRYILCKIKHIYRKGAKSALNGTLKCKYFI